MGEKESFNLHQLLVFLRAIFLERKWATNFPSGGSLVPCDCMSVGLCLTTFPLIQLPFSRIERGIFLPQSKSFHICILLATTH